MADFEMFELGRGQKALQSLNRKCADFAEVREFLKQRGRRENEQLVVLHQGLIYAIERRDGNGFAMVEQDRQNQEDANWYP